MRTLHPRDNSPLGQFMAQNCFPLFTGQPYKDSALNNLVVITLHPITGLTLEICEDSAEARAAMDEELMPDVHRHFWLIPRALVEDNSHAPS